MATKITLLCDWCGKEPTFMEKPSKAFSYKADFKFAQCNSNYEFCSRECLYALLQSMLHAEYKRNDNSK